MANTRKALFYIAHVMRHFVMVGCFLLIASFIASQFYTGMASYPPLKSDPFRMALLPLLCLAFFSVARCFVVYDSSSRARAFSLGEPAYRGPRLWKETFLSFDFLTGAAVVFLLVFALAPGSAFCGLLEPFGFSALTAWQSLASRLIFLPLSLAILFFAHLSARKHWRQVKNNSLVKDTLALLGMLALVGIAYGFGIFYLLAALPFVAVLCTPEIGIPVGVAVLVLAALVWSLTYGKLLRQRRRFVKALTALCAHEGFALSAIKHPYRSLFRLQDGPSFTVTAHGKSYTCKLLSCVARKTRAIYFSGDGECRFVRAFKIRGVELFRTVTDFRFAFEGAGKKLLVIDPMPALYLADLGKTVSLDIGDKAWSYKIFSAASFLGNLERDCLDR